MRDEMCDAASFAVGGDFFLCFWLLGGFGVSGVG